MQTRRSIVIAVSMSFAANAGFAGDLVVGFATDNALQVGESITLATATGPDVGAVAALGGDPAVGMFVAAGGLLRKLTPDGTAVLATFPPPHDVVALAATPTSLFVASADGIVTELSPATGAFVRATSLAMSVRAMIADGGRLYVAAANGQLWSAAITDLVWKLEATSLSSNVNSIAARGTSLLVGTPGHVFVFERDSGAFIYGYNVPNDAAALALEGNDVVVGGNDGTLYRVDPGTGAVHAATTFTASGSPVPVTALAITGAAPFAALRQQSTFVSISAPTPNPLRLEVGDAIGGMPYLVLGSVTGTSPGIMLGGKHVPLNLDPYLLLSFTGNPLLLGGLGSFSDANVFGVFMADAWFQIPAGLPPSVVGFVVTHAFVVFDPATGAVRAASNPMGTFLGS
jgi:PQQ-like domain